MLVDYKNTNIYQSDELILKDVNFHVDEDQFVYVIGKVGAGKSSLLKTMYCELDLHKDSTETADVLGRNVLTIKRREIPALRREMGIIFQDFSSCTIAMSIRIWNLYCAPPDGKTQKRLMNG